MALADPTLRRSTASTTGIAVVECLTPEEREAMEG